MNKTYIEIAAYEHAQEVVENEENEHLSEEDRQVVLDTIAEDFMAGVRWYESVMATQN